MTRRFEVFWTVVLVVSLTPAGVGTVYWWNESGLLSAAAWAIGFGILNYLLIRLMLRSIERRL